LIAPRDAYFEHVFPISIVTRASVSRRKLRLRDRAIARLGPYQIAIAANGGLAPMMFIARVTPSGDGWDTH